MSDPAAVSAPGVAERARRWLAPPVAFLASCLALICLTSVPDVLTDLEELATANERFAGWAGLGLLLGLALAAVALLTAPYSGPGPALSVGAAAAVFGLALGSEVIDDLQAGLAFCVLGLAVGGLLAGAASMPLELPGWSRAATLVAWVTPLAAGWPLLTWVALHDPSVEGARLVTHPSVWALAPVSAVLVLWSALSMLIEPPRAGAGGGVESWETVWSGLLAVGGASGLLVMLLGFESDVSRSWLRPLVIFGVAVVVVALAAVILALPSVSTRIAAAGVTVTGLCVPSCVQLAMVISDAGKERVGWQVVSILVAAGLAGVALGWAFADRAVAPALLVVAGAAAGSWVMPDGPWLMTASIAPMLLGAGAALAAGVRLAGADAMSWRFVAMLVVTVVMVGVTISIPLGWSLAGAVAANVDDARAAARVFVGLTFAAAVMAAAYVATLWPPRVAASSSDELTPAGR